MKHVFLLASLTLAVSSLALASPSPPVPLPRPPSPATLYKDCMRLAYEQPTAGLDRAKTWQEDGGGAPAQHCLAAALVQVGRSADAATLLEELAKSRPDLEADLLRQAAQVWMRAMRPPKALAALNAALQHTPGQTALLEDRAVVYMTMGEDRSAVNDLDQALDATPDSVAALAVRAAAHRRLGESDLAWDDVNRALALQPDYPDALLEKGALFHLEGNKAAAQETWTAIVHAGPTSPAAAEARANLQAMGITVGE